MRVIKTVVASVLLILAILTIYHTYSLMFYSNYVASEVALKEMLRVLWGKKCYRLANITTLGFYLLTLLNIWNTEK